MPVPVSTRALNGPSTSSTRCRVVSARSIKPSGLVLEPPNPSPHDDVDVLASRLATALQVKDGPSSKSNGFKASASTSKRAPARTNKATENKPSVTMDEALSSIERSRLAMRAVNTACQTLGSVIQSGWRLSASSSVRASTKSLPSKPRGGEHDTEPHTEPQPTHTTESVSKVVASCRGALKTLRGLRGQIEIKAVDVERAAACLAGQLTGLEMWSVALEVLTESQENILALYQHEPWPLVTQQCSASSPPLRTSTKSAPRPKPATRRTPGAAADNLTAKFELLRFPPLADSVELHDTVLNIVASSQLHALNALLHSIDHSSIHGFLAPLQSSGTLLDLCSIFRARLGPKVTSSHLTSAFRIVARSLSSSQSLPPVALFGVREWALHCFVRADEASAHQFWEQAMRWAATFVKSIPSGKTDEEKSACQRVNLLFKDLIARAADRSDSVEFKSGSGFLAFSEWWITVARRVNDRDTIGFITDLVVIAGRGRGRTEDVGIAITTAHTRLSHAEAMVKQLAISGKDEGVEGHLKDAAVILGQVAGLYLSGAESVKKLQTEVERLRNSCEELMDARVDHSADLDGPATGSKGVLAAIASLAEEVLRAKEDDHARLQLPASVFSDLFTSAVNSLLLLGHYTLIPAQHVTHHEALSFLERAVSIARNTPPQEAADFLRIISIDFQEAARTLYTKGKAPYAIKFAEISIALGEEALHARRREPAIGNTANDWHSLEEQMGRRCEMLASCYMKRGDRKLAHGACIRALSWSPPSTLDALRLASASESIRAIFDSQPYLASVIDRITSLATSELLLQGPELTLRGHLEAKRLPSEIVGAILEYQLLGLESSLHKPDTLKAVSSLIDELVAVYTPQEYPIRRARGSVLLRKLAHLHHTASSSLSSSVGQEIFETLDREEGLDGGLAAFVPQYRAATHLWLTLHAHADQGLSCTASVLHHARQAIQIVRSSIVHTPSPSMKPEVPATTARPKPTSKSTSKTPAKTPSRTTRNGISRNGNGQQLPKTPLPPISPPRGRANETQSVVSLDDVERFYKHLEMMSELLNLLGLSLVRLELLDVMRQVNERYRTRKSGCDGILLTCAESAYEHARLGKTGAASHLYAKAMAWSTRQDCSSPVSDDARVRFLLRYASSLAGQSNLDRSESLYEEARGLSASLPAEEASSTAARVRAQTIVIERSALAASVYSAIQEGQDDIVPALSSMRRAVRLWTRALDNLSRISPPADPPAHPVAESNPFLVEEPNAEKPAEADHPKQSKRGRIALDGLQWRVAQGLYRSLITLAEWYFCRGSSPQADYYLRLAIEFASGMNAPAPLARALAQQGEIHLLMGDNAEGNELLRQASSLLDGITGPEVVETLRIKADRLLREGEKAQALELYSSASAVLCEMEDAYSKTAISCHTPRKVKQAHKGSKTRLKEITDDDSLDVILPVLQAALLRQRVWLSREGGKEFEELLIRLLSLPPIGDLKAEENALLGQLHLHEACEHFRGDLFLSTLTESTIAVPLGMTSGHAMVSPPSNDGIISLLDQSEEKFWVALELMSHKGKVWQIRKTSISLALIRAFQTSLGKISKKGPRVAAALLEMSCATTLRRQMLESFELKSRVNKHSDDLVWPSRHPSNASKNLHRAGSTSEQSEDDSQVLDDDPYEAFWEATRSRYRALTPDMSSGVTEQVDMLPENWTVISINVTEDKGTMLIARHRPKHQPLIFCLPLDRHGRREGDEDHLPFQRGIDELDDIIFNSNEKIRGAQVVEGRDAKLSWWSERGALDKRLEDLLHNMEFCWLGAFKTIMSEPTKATPEMLNGLRSRFDRIFRRHLRLPEKGPHSRTRVDDNILHCFATLSPKCLDLELEDLVYFVLDLYTCHGVPVALAEIDVDEVVTDLRTALEEFGAQVATSIEASEADLHTFLVLDKNVQGIPWESMPVLRGRSVSRIPSISFLIDRLEFARHRRRLDRDAAVVSGDVDAAIDRIAVNPRNTFYMLNATGDLIRTEQQFSPWLRSMSDLGWKGTIGRPPMEGEMLSALQSSDLVLYFGHNGGERYVRATQIRGLPSCAAVMLWGCSSGALRRTGEFDRSGTPHDYMLAGSPSVVATLWDVTDRDIDRYSDSVFKKLGLDHKSLESGMPRPPGQQTSIVKAVAQSRDVCKLKYLTGAATVVYGIPYYL